MPATLAAVTAPGPTPWDRRSRAAAWPQRIARDGTLHVTTVSSTWAFELGRMEEDVRGKLARAGRGRDAAVAPVRARSSPLPRGRGAAGPQPLAPTPPEEAEAASVSAEIEDPGLRDAVPPGGRSEPRGGPRRPCCLIYFSRPAKPLFCRHFLVQEGRDRDRVHRKGHHRSRGARARQAPPRDVHRLDRHTGSPPPCLRGRRQRRRRGPRRSQRARRRHDPPRRLDHRPGRRPRHSGRSHGGAGPLGADGRPDEAPRRREVRRRRLQGLGRPARRRHLGRQRALRVAHRGGPSRREGAPPAVRARRRPGRRRGDERDEGERDDDLVPARPGDLRRDRVPGGDARAATAGDGVPHARAADRPARRAARRQDRRVPLRGRDQRLRDARQLGKDPVHKHVVYFEGENDDGQLEVAMQWNTSYVESVFSFANNIHTDGGRHASLGLPCGADRHAQPLRARQGPAEGEGGQPRGRGRPRGPRRRHLREAAQPAVRGTDEDEARQPSDREPRQDRRQPEARRVPRGEPDRGEADHHEGDLGRARPSRGAQGA